MASSAQPMYGYADPALEFAHETRSRDPADHAPETAVPANQQGDQLHRESVPTGSDTDSLTRATVAKMCQYIRASAADPFVQSCARLAIRFAPPFPNASPPAAGVFWFLKHKVRRVLDEGTGIRLDETQAADILIAPDVLLRMENPQEDCDGFTMAAAAMLMYLGVPTCIATVACDPNDASRFSHVFNMVQTPAGEWMPLDCSHGREPGWMVPAHRITRWQTWDLSANPIDITMPMRSPMRGYVSVRRTRRSRGMGQVCDPTDPTSVCPLPSLGYDPTELIAAEGPAPAATSTGATSLSPAQLTSLISQAVAGATKVASIAELPQGASLTSTGQVISSSLNSLMPLLMIGLGAFLIISLVEGAGHK